MFGSACDASVAVVMSEVTVGSVGDGLAAAPAEDQLAAGHLVSPCLRLAVVGCVVAAFLAGAAGPVSCPVMLGAASTLPLAEGWAVEAATLGHVSAGWRRRSRPSA